MMSTEIPEHLIAQAEKAVRDAWVADEGVAIVVTTALQALLDSGEVVLRGELHYAKHKWVEAVESAEQYRKERDALAIVNETMKAGLLAAVRSVAPDDFEHVGWQRIDQPQTLISSYLDSDMAAACDKDPTLRRVYARKGMVMFPESTEERDERIERAAEEARRKVRLTPGQVAHIKRLRTAR
jgi:hypothetical protein